jgi:hypothetical protein
LRPILPWHAHPAAHQEPTTGDFKGALVKLTKMVAGARRNINGRVGIIYHAVPPEHHPLQNAVFEVGRTLGLAGLLDVDLRSVQDKGKEDKDFVGEHTREVWRFRAKQSPLHHSNEVLKHEVELDMPSSCRKGSV